MKQIILKCLFVIAVIAGINTGVTAQTPAAISVTNNNTVHIINWTDAIELIGETYNVYMAESPITNVSAGGVFSIGTDIAEGVGAYEYQLYIPDPPGGDAVIYYYAVTVVVDGIENTSIIAGQNATTEGETGTTTWGLAMVWYDSNYYSPPVPDGDMCDWAPFSVYLDPTSPDNRVFNGEFDGPEDCSGYIYVGADEDAFYFGADLDDDRLEHNYPSTDGYMWRGDVVEYYLGVFDKRPSDPVHVDFYTSPEPDFHINVKSNAGTDPCMCIYTSGAIETCGFPTTSEQWCNSRIPGDLSSGRISEVKLPYTELEWDPLNQPIPRPRIGWVLPCNIMISDTDTPGSRSREGQMSWSNYEAAAGMYTEPNNWKHQVVIYDPKQLGYIPPPPFVVSVVNNNTVHIIVWNDMWGLTGESYNVYMSESPITDVCAADVFLIGSGIPEGADSYEYKLYTPYEPGNVNYYYAVTVVSDGVENTAITAGANATTTGEAGTTTWGLAMVWMDGSVYNPPVPDGDMSDWAPFNVYMDPCPPGGMPLGEFDDADDCSGYLYCAANEEALYFGADIDDDRLVHNYPGTDDAMWKGDVVEYYLGVYDRRPSDPCHDAYQSSPEPDFQIDVKSNAGTDPCMCIYTGGAIRTQGFPATSEQWCNSRIPGDLSSGRISEVKLPYTELEWDPLNQPVPRPRVGWILPCNMMISDTDTPGSMDREGQLSWSNDEAAASSWSRPDVWRHQVIIYDPKKLKHIYPTQATGISLTNNNTVHIVNWSDASGLPAANYNVYMSKSPITNVSAADVFLIGTGIPEGAGSYEYRLYTPDTGGENVTYYYAVTVVSDAVENTEITTGENATTEGEAGTTTWGLAMAWMDGSVYSPPVPDGDMSDWLPFNVYLDPLSPENRIVHGDIDDANDCSGHLYCAADKDAFYFGAYITDDYLENIYPVSTCQMWNGDVVEYYLGIYDIRPSDIRHEDPMCSPEPDFQIDIKSNAGTDPCIRIYTSCFSWLPAGTEQWCGPRVPGDLSSGRTSEAKLPYTELEWDPLYQPVPRPKIGWVLPCNMMISDTDTPGGMIREGQLSWSNHEEADFSWTCPYVWKHQVVIYDPKQLRECIQSVAQPQLVDIPENYGLAQNYPNPFNLGTTIRYRLSGNSQVTLTIYNLMGQKVKTLVNENQPAGFYLTRWDGTDKNSALVPSGVYVCMLNAGSFVAHNKMLLLK